MTKIYKYFISYVGYTNENNCFCNLTADLDGKLDSGDKIQELHLSLAEKIGFEKIVILNFQLLSND